MSQGLHNTLFVEYGLTKLLVPQLVDLREIVVGGAPPEPPTPPPSEGFDAVKALEFIVRGPSSAPIPPSGLTSITTSDNFQSKINAGSVNEKFGVAPGTYNVVNLSPKTGQEFYATGLGVIFEGSGTAVQAISGSAGVTNVLWQGMEIRNYVSKCIFVNQGSAWRIHFVHAHHAVGSDTKGAVIHLGANGGCSVMMNILSHGEAQVINAQSGGDTIDNNEIHHGNESGQAWNSSAGLAAGCKSHSAASTIYLKNYLHDNAGPDIWFDATNSDPGDRVVENLIIGGANNDGPGVMYEISSGTNAGNQAIIRGNVIQDVDHSAYFISEAQWVTIKDGLVERCWGSLTSREGARAQNVDNVTFQDMVVDQRNIGTGQYPRAAGVLNNQRAGTTHSWLRNIYTISPAIANPFRWEGQNISVAEWRVLFPTEVITVA